MEQSSETAVRAGAWGLLAGLVGSLCCIGPSAAVLLGLGASSALFGIHVDRPLTLAGGAALLLGGVALRRDRACAVRPATLWRQPALMLATFALSYGLLGLLLPSLAAQREDAATASFVAPAAPAPALRRVTLLAEKMDCPPCVVHLRGLLKRQPFVHHFVAEDGIEQVVVDYDSRQVNARGLMALIPQQYNISLIGDVALP